MKKVQVYNNLKDLHEAQRKDSELLTATQRLEQAFHLIDLAVAMSPDKKLRSEGKDNLPWIELHFKK